MQKNEVSRVDLNRKLDPTWEGPYLAVNCNYNGSFKLQVFEGTILLRTWNSDIFLGSYNIFLRKLYQITPYVFFYSQISNTYFI